MLSYLRFIRLAQTVNNFIDMARVREGFEFPPVLTQVLVGWILVKQLFELLIIEGIDTRDMCLEKSV